MNYRFYGMLNNLLVTVLFLVFAGQGYGVNQISDEQIFEKWVDTVEKAYALDGLSQGEIYDDLTNSFYEIYRQTGNTTFLDYSLHESGRTIRSSIVNELSADEIQSVKHILLKLDQRELSDDYFRIRRFTAKDLYIFLRLNEIPSEKQASAKQLLDYWYERLPTIERASSLTAQFKVQALVNGYFLLNDDEKVARLSNYLDRNTTFPVSTFSIDFYSKIAFSARLSGYYEEALNMYQEILLPMANQLGNRNRYLTIRMDYANTLFRIGNVNLYLSEYEAIFQEIDHLQDPRYRSALLNNLAISYLNTGKFEQYVEFQLNAYQIAAAEENYSQQISILRNLFIFYNRQNEFELAYQYLNQALIIAQNENLDNDIASILISSGVYNRNILLKNEIALQDFYEALELSEQTSNYIHYFNSHIELATTYLKLNKFEKARHYFSEAITISNERGDTRNYAQASIRLANALADNQLAGKAELIIADITSEMISQVPFDIQVMANNINIKILIEKGRYQEAVNHSENKITDIINWLKESSDQQTGHMRMDPEFTDAFRLHTLLMAETGNYRQAITTLGELRNISRSGFYNNPLLRSKVLTEDELIQDHNLSSRIQQLRNQYATASEEQKIYLGNELLNAISERNNLLNRAFPHYRESSYETVFSQLRRQLRPDQMIIYFSVFEDQVFRFGITRQGIRMKAFPNDPAYLEMVDKAVNTIGYGSTNLEYFYDVYSTFFEGIIPNRVNHIYFIPDGQFYRLPLEILPVSPPSSPGSYGSTTYFVEQYSVSYANTLSDLIREPDDPTTPYEYDLAAFGISSFAEAGHSHLSDLPFSTTEISLLAEQLTQFPNKKLFKNQQSTEQHFRDITGRSRILHLATHSRVNNENPLFSSLYLFRDQTNETAEDENLNDGVIYAYELFDMNMNADLIFLSSCESGSGGYLQGAGVLGLSRAFSYAGAKSLSINLWPIRDQTAAEISTRFYSGINSGKNKAHAMREAQLHYLNHTNSDPYLWGAFVLYGNIDSPLNDTAKEEMINIVMGGTFATAIFLILIFFYQRDEHSFTMI